MKKRGILQSKFNLFVIFIIIASFWLAQISGTVAAPSEQGGDIAVISSPTNNAVVQDTVEIIGSADHPSFQFYVVDIGPEPNTNDQWSTVGMTHETPVINGLLETWDTTLVPDGSYTIRLRVVRLDGNYGEFFARQVVVSNTQPIPTDTPPPQETPLSPTVTPTNLPATPTIAIEQPVVDTPTPRPVPTSPPLADPDEDSSFIPTVTGFSVSPLRDACLYGGALMLSIFFFFGFLAALRIFIRGFIDLIKRRSS